MNNQGNVHRDVCAPVKRTQMRYMVGVDITFPPWYSNGPVGLFDPSVGLYVLPALPTRFSSLSLQLFCPGACGGGGRGDSSLEESEGGKLGESKVALRTGGSGGGLIKLLDKLGISQGMLETSRWETRVGGH